MGRQRQPRNRSACKNSMTSIEFPLFEISRIFSCLSWLSWVSEESVSQLLWTDVYINFSAFHSMSFGRNFLYVFPIVGKVNYIIWLYTLINFYPAFWIKYLDSFFNFNFYLFVNWFWYQNDSNSLDLVNFFLGLSSHYPTNLNSHP